MRPMRYGVLFASLAAVAACGRIGFGLHPGDAAGGDGSGSGSGPGSDGGPAVNAIAVGGNFA